MLSIGWTEMLVVAAVALIVVGPRDLPAMLRQMGKFVGMARRMSNDFRSEINKITAMEEMTDIRKSLTDPIRNAKQEIEQEFNRKSIAGDTEPTGALKPDPGAEESVVQSIQQQAGMIDDSDLEEPARTSISSAVTKALAEAEGAQEKPPAKTAAFSKSGKPPATGKTSPKSASPKSARSKSASSEARGKTGAAKSTAAKSTTTKSVASGPATAKPAASKRATAAKSGATKSATAKAETSKTPAARTTPSKSAAPKTASVKTAAATRPAAKRPAATKPAAKRSAAKSAQPAPAATKSNGSMRLGTRLNANEQAAPATTEKAGANGTGSGGNANPKPARAKTGATANKGASKRTKSTHSASKAT